MTATDSPPPFLRGALTSVDRSLGRLLPGAARLVAREHTDQILGRRLLVLSPHPDDETLSCGITIQRAIACGGEVTVVVVTDGRHGDPKVEPARMMAIRRDELERAAAVLGLPRSGLVTLGFEDASLSQNEDRLAHDLSEIIDPLPEVVIAPSPLDVHPDHAALGRVARRILAGRPVQHLEYLVWGWDQPIRLAVRAARSWQENLTRLRRPILVDGAGYVDSKAEALACYPSQFSPTASLHGRSIAGVGPLGNDFLRRFRDESELFFPRAPRGPLVGS